MSLSLTVLSPTIMHTGNGLPVAVDSITVQQVQLPFDFTAPVAAPEPIAASLPLLPGLAYLHEGYSVLGMVHPADTALVVRPKDAKPRPECAAGTENGYHVKLGLDKHEAITATDCECQGWLHRREGKGPCRHGRLVEAVGVWIATLRRVMPYLREREYTLSSCWAIDGIELLTMVAPLGSRVMVARLRGSEQAGYVVDGLAEARRLAGLGGLGGQG